MLRFLSIVLDSNAMECHLPEDKLVALKMKLHGILGLRKIQLRMLQSLLGKLSFAWRIIPIGGGYIPYPLYPAQAGASGGFEGMALVSGTL